MSGGTKLKRELRDGSAAISGILCSALAFAIFMAIAVLFSLCVISAGYLTLRVLGSAGGARGLGLAPGMGLAALAIVSTWLGVLGAPTPVAGVVVLALALGGLGLAMYERRSIGNGVLTAVGEQRAVAGLLVTALAVPMLVMGVAFAGVQVPLSPHDGAAHTEVIQGFRLGQSTAGWYPPGLAALFGAWLQLVPWLDSAEEAFDLGLSLPLLAVLAVFGLGAAVWRNLRMAGASALLLGFTYVFPYFPELWSGWPLAMSLILVITVWTISLAYLDCPSWRWGVLAGLVLGGIALVHGTEMYTLALSLPVLLVGGWRRVVWSGLLRHAGIAVLLGVACAAVYLPALVGWAHAGGAYAVGLEDTQTLFNAAGVSSEAGLQDPFVVFALGALGIDLPLRVALVVVGSVRAFREKTGRFVCGIGVLFAALASTFSFLSGIPPVHQVYAITFPWGMHYRMFMLVAIAQVLLAGAGSISTWQAIETWTHKPGAGTRVLRRLSRLLLVTWLGLITWGMVVFLAYPPGQALGYTSDDAAAMGWLRQHAGPGEVLLNDGYADAGIWAPYKAGMPILLPRWQPLAPDEQRARLLVLDNVGRLDQAPEAAAAACAHHVAYAYHGAAESAWDKRRFPPLAELRASAALRELFRQNEAVVFQVQLACPR